MAQGAIASLPANGTMALTAEELYEILECEKIVRFRDAVLSGTHPRIKVPSHLNGKSNTRYAPSPNSRIPRPNLPQPQAELNAIASSTNVEDIQTRNNTKSSNSLRMATGRSAATMPMMAKAEINPILLEKSDDLIKAETQLQRQRLERALREQVDQRRLSLKASMQTSESLPDFDISDVLSKALTVVHPSTAAEADQPVGDHASASDSFDDNTFYSSQHDTPEQSSSSQEHRWHHDIPTQGIVLTAVHPVESAMDRNLDDSRDVVMAEVSLSNHVESGPHQSIHHASPLVQNVGQTAAQLTSPPGFINAASGLESQIQPHKEDNNNSTNENALPPPDATVSPQPDSMSGLSSKTPEHFADLAMMQTGALLKRKFFETVNSLSADMVEPAIIRTREDVPTLAPQPARVSPLATARAPPVIGQSMMADEAQSAQVNALRKSLAVSSPDSSPKGSKPSDRKKSKKKKPRKSSGKQAITVDTPDSPYIKPEPRSLSPFAAPPLPRPLPRQRQTLQQGQELNYDEPRYEVPREAPREQIISSHHSQRPGYERPDNDQMYEPIEADAYGYRRVPRNDKYRRIVSHDAYRIPTPPGVPGAPYPLKDQRPIRAASHAIAERHFQEPTRTYRDMPPRASVRIDADRERSRSPIMRERRSPILMAPPSRLPPAHIVIDEYGRQYYAPPPVPVPSRLSVVPTNRPVDEDFVYERTSLRQAERPVSDLYEEDSVVYRRSTPPPLPPSRRILTQPEQESDYRSYRQREYSSRPVARVLPSEEYVRIREPIERRQMSHFEEVPRQHVTRMGSVRPEGTRYGMPREYVTRVQSVRPEAQFQDYAHGIRQEPRRDITAHPIREYSVRPGEPEIIRREYMQPQEGTYTPAMPIVRRVLDDADYIERPREVGQDLYADDLGREVYR